MSQGGEEHQFFPGAIGIIPVGVFHHTTDGALSNSRRCRKLADAPKPRAEALGRPPCQPHRFAARRKAPLAENLRMRTRPRGTLFLN